MSDATTPLFFRLFNEIGIIDQLAKTVLESRLPRGLLAPHFAVLNHLVRVGDGSTPLNMARAFQIPKATMTHQIGVLERHDLVKQMANPNDRRSKQVWITDEGRSLREKIANSFGEEIQKLTEVISPAEIADLVPRLEHIRKCLDESRSI